MDRLWADGPNFSYPGGSTGQRDCLGLRQSAPSHAAQAHENAQAESAVPADLLDATLFKEILLGRSDQQR
jgi:hypothetical protein